MEESLKRAIELNEKFQKKNKKKTYVQKELLKLVESFIINKKLVCYGGTAINNILPKNNQFYNPSIDIPDYDFFSNDAIQHAKELAKILVDAKYDNVEAKPAFVHGTYKVFVNFIPIADITQLSDNVFKNIQGLAIKKKKILYAPASYLRMSLYQELSRPLGDVSRWEKIYKRLKLLNQHYPFKVKELNFNDKTSNIEDVELVKKLQDKSNDLKKISKKHDAVFFGEYALFFYSIYFPQSYRNIMENKKILKLMVFSENVKPILEDIKKKEEYTIVESTHDTKLLCKYYCVKMENKSLLYIFETNSCQSYNKIVYKHKKYNIASIDTILSLYFSLYLINDDEFNKELLLSYCYLLNRIILKLDNIMTNSIQNETTNDDMSPILRRFHLPCSGIQPSYETILQERNRMYNKLKKNKTSKLYEKWFFKYYPNKKTHKNKK